MYVTVYMSLGVYTPGYRTSSPWAAKLSWLENACLYPLLDGCGQFWPVK